MVRSSNPLPVPVEALETAVARHVEFNNTSGDAQEEDEEEEEIVFTTVGDPMVPSRTKNDKTTTTKKKKKRTTKHSGEHNNDDDEDEDDEDDDDNEESIKLYKSPRLKGYITLVLASIINFNAASLSADPIATNVVPASSTQQRYAKAVALGSAIVTGFLVITHLDRYTPFGKGRFNKIWKIAWGPKSKIELGVILCLVLWWCVATIVQTSVRGIAGDGKEQYNLYYSTWVCCWTTIWTLERKCVDMYGWSTLRVFITSWPYRAPGWIAIWVSCFFTLFWYLDLFLNTSQDDTRIPETLKPFYQTIPRSQYQWLLFVSAVTLLPSSIFIFVEIFRETTQTEQDEVAVKGPLENILEGFVLLLLSIGWIPSVIVATTPGGFASLVGNAYFFTWGTTVFVMETSLWFIHDFRGNVHKVLEEKEGEYRRHQQKVLQQSQTIAAHYGTTSTTHPTTATTTTSVPLPDRASSWSPIQVPATHQPFHSPPSSPSPQHGDNNNNNCYESEELEYPPDHQDDPSPPSEYHRNNQNHHNDQLQTPPPRSRILFPPATMRDFDDDDDDADGDADSEIQRELRLKQTHSSEYYDTLDDILE